MSEYVRTIHRGIAGGLITRGEIDLTYRCNNNCLHCWVRKPVDGPERLAELDTEGVLSILERGKRQGCLHWGISGGEPMLRADFIEIMKFMLNTGAGFSLNTNGTLITPEIARLLRARGTKMVAMYGPSAEIHDSITRTPGAFEKFIRGCRYLKESGAGFTVQLVPMNANKHAFKDMVDLAQNLSPHWRIGADWLFLSADGNAASDRDIRGQRMDPDEILHICRPKPGVCAGSGSDQQNSCSEEGSAFAHCLARRNTFHVDPYGRMSFCCFIKEERLRYDINRGTFDRYWNVFLPSLQREFGAIPPSAMECSGCENLQICRWCPAYAFLETRTYTSKIPYLCRMAKTFREYGEKLAVRKRNRFAVAGMWIELEMCSPFHDRSFAPVFTDHIVHDSISEPDIRLRHHDILDSGEPAHVTQGAELVAGLTAIRAYRGHGMVIYEKVVDRQGGETAKEYAVFNSQYTAGDIYYYSDTAGFTGYVEALAGILPDEVFLAHVLARRRAVIFHASAVSRAGRGYLFVGHSGAGKSTIASFFREKGARLISEDRVIVKIDGDGVNLYGNWLHAWSRRCLPGPVPLEKIFFLNKADSNCSRRVHKASTVVKKLFPQVVRPLTSKEWWELVLEVLVDVQSLVECHELFFDRSGRIVSRITGEDRGLDGNSIKPGSRYNG